MTADDRNDLPSSGRSSFEQLMREQRSTLLAHVRLVYPNVDAESVVNDSFSIAWRRLEDAEVESPTAWMRSIARYVVMNADRGQRRWRALNDRVALLEVQPPVEPPDTDARLQLSMVLKALERLGPRDREILLMIALDDLSIEDLATIYAVSATAAKVRLSRARKRLRAAVARTDVAASPATSIAERRRSR